MSLFQSITLSIIQGITEFLPISSSGHLIVVPWLLGWEAHPLFFDIMLHVAAFCAIAIYFRKEWMKILREGFLSVREKTMNGPVERRLFWYIILAIIPSVIFGGIIGDKAESYFRNPMLVCLMLGAFGVVLYFAELIDKRDKSLGDITWQIALLIGLAQIFAFIPGVSRSAVTIGAALALGMNRESSVRFSFILGAPVIFAAACYHIKDVIKIGNIVPYHIAAAGFIVTFLSSIAAIHFLLSYVRRHSFTIFVIYRILASIFIMGVILYKG